MSPGQTVHPADGPQGGTAAGGGVPVLDLNLLDGVIFDVDGVITDTARVHAAAWKRMFDALLREHARRMGVPMKPFSLHIDYRRYVDGKPRLDGLRSFLAARGITLPEGTPDDRPGARTVWGQALLKDRYFRDRLHRGGALVFGSSVELLHRLRRHGVRTAAVSSSRNAAAVLASVGVQDLFDARVDGEDLLRAGMPGKPDPAIFLAAAQRMHTAPARTAVVEDALAGVKAGRRGGFGLIVGVDRGSDSADLRRCGAHVVVTDLGELSVRERSS